MKTVYNISALSLLLLLIVSCGGQDKSSAEFDARVDKTLAFAEAQLLKTADAIDDPTRFPTGSAPDGSWNTSNMYGWTSGFFPGSLWYAYENSSNEQVKLQAERWTAGLDSVQYYTGNHDLGFMMFCSYGNGYRLTGNDAYREVIVQSARSLTTRYNPVVGLIQSWNANDRWDYPVIIDNMMNLELLFWAAKHGGDQKMYNIAVTHALNTMNNHVREDGSTPHVIGYDPETGTVKSVNTHQGYADDSTWARGQAWGVYGFTMTYRETGDDRFLKTAMRLADWFINHLPADHIPYWDFNAPQQPSEPRDSSAGAIAASALLELSTFVDDPAVKERYHDTAIAILNELMSERYLADPAASQAIILHGVGSKPHNSQVDVALTYGDYYFIEALMRYKRGIVREPQ